MELVKSFRPTSHHPENCICCLVCWWREMQELEAEIGFCQCSAKAQAQWDAILSTQIPHPNPALGFELRHAAIARAAVWMRSRKALPPLLEMLTATAFDEALALPEFALLAAFKLRRSLETRVREVWQARCNDRRRPSRKLE